MTTLTCEHCESEIDVEKDPGCIQDGGLDVMCESCRELAYQRWLMNVLWEQHESHRIKRGWRA